MRATRSKFKHENNLQNGKAMPTQDLTDLIGRTFLLIPKEDIKRFRGKIIETIADNNRNFVNNPVQIYSQ